MSGGLSRLAAVCVALAVLAGCQFDPAVGTWSEMAAPAPPSFCDDLGSELFDRYVGPATTDTSVHHYGVKSTARCFVRPANDGPVHRRLQIDLDRLAMDYQGIPGPELCRQEKKRRIRSTQSNRPGPWTEEEVSGVGETARRLLLRSRDTVDGWLFACRGSDLVVVEYSMDPGQPGAVAAALSGIAKRVYATVPG